MSVPDPTELVHSCGNSIIFPPRLGTTWNYGQIEYDQEDDVIQITFATLDRTFVFRVQRKDVLAAVWPGALSGILQLSDPANTWQFGDENIVAESVARANELGIAFVSRNADVHWSVDGVTSATHVVEVLDCVQSPRDIVFQESLCCPPPQCKPYW